MAVPGKGRVEELRLRRGEELQLSPGPDTELARGDVLVVACELAKIGQVAQLLSPPQNPGGE